MSTVETIPTVEPPKPKKSFKKKVLIDSIVAEPDKEEAKKARGKKAKGKIKKLPAKKAPTKRKLISVEEQAKNAKDRAAAKSVGLGLIHYRVLRSLRRATTAGEAMTYRDIEKSTGYYAPLASILHTDFGFKEGSSLCGKSLARQSTVADKNDRDHVAFTITAKGAKLLEKAARKPAKME
mgnify:FL=1